MLPAAPCQSCNRQEDAPELLTAFTHCSECPCGLQGLHRHCISSTIEHPHAYLLSNVQTLSHCAATPVAQGIMAAQAVMTAESTGRVLSPVPEAASVVALRPL